MRTDHPSNCECGCHETHIDLRVILTALIFLLFLAKAALWCENGEAVNEKTHLKSGS
jgi:hypothetical protein